MALRSALFAAAFVIASGVPVAHAQADFTGCVPAELREHVIKFRTDDDVELSGLALGSGSRGVLLASDGLLLDACDWVPFARRLADDGFRVLLYEARGVKLDRDKRRRFDLDVVAAARELTERGASSVVAGGSGAGANAIAATAAKIPELAGIFMLTPFSITNSADGTSLDAVEALKSVEVPVLVAASLDDRVKDVEGDEDFFVAVDEAQELADAAPNSRLEMVPGNARGVALVKDGERMHGEVRSFVGATMPVRWYERWLLPIGGSVAVVLALVAFIVLRRRRSASV